MPEPDKAFMHNSSEHQQDLQLIVNAAREAGIIAMGYFGENPKVWMKEGNSPVSEADHAANDYLMKTLMAARPDYGWLSEETEDGNERLDKIRLFVVDPIDGTRGFIDGNAKWCVSVAIVEAGRPVCGVLECPALQETYTALKNNGSFLNGDQIYAKNSGDTLQMAGPKSLISRHIKESGAKIDLAPFVPSLAYRLALVSNGTLYGNYARANCHDWDIAAADILLEEANASLVNLDGSRIKYNRAKTSHGVLTAAANNSIKPMLRSAQIETKLPDGP